MKKIGNYTTYLSLTDKINVYYNPNFLSNEQAKQYFNLFEKELVYNPKEASMVTVFGKKYPIPRKQVAYGETGIKYSFSGVQVDALSWDNDNKVSIALKEIKDKVELITGKKFNFVLINRYADGTQHIGAHKDDEKELGDAPDIVGVSLGAERDFILENGKYFYSKKMPNKLNISLGNGSLISMCHPTNKYWLHSVPKRLSIKRPRISLTFRYIYK